MGISILQFEHLIDGKKPDALVVFAMIACHIFPALIRVASRNFSRVGHASIRVCSSKEFQTHTPLCLPFVNVTSNLDIIILCVYMTIIICDRRGKVK